MGAELPNRRADGGDWGQMHPHLPYPAQLTFTRRYTDAYAKLGYRSAANDVRK